MEKFETHLQGVGKGKSNHSRRKFASTCNRSDGEAGSPKNDYCSNKLQSNGQPPVDDTFVINISNDLPGEINVPICVDGREIRP